MALSEVPAADRVKKVSFSELKEATGNFSDRIDASSELYRGNLMHMPVAAKLFTLSRDASTADRDATRKLVENALRMHDQLKNGGLVRLLAYSVDEEPDSEQPYALILEQLEGGILADWLGGPGGEPPARSRDAAPAAGAGAGTGAGAGAGAGAAADTGGEGARCSLSALERVDMLLGLAGGLVHLHGEEAAEPVAVDGFEAAAGAVDGFEAAAGAAAGGAGAAAPPRRAKFVHRLISAASVGLTVLPDGQLNPKWMNLEWASPIAAARAGAAAGAGAGAAAGTVTPVAVGSAVSTVAGTPGHIPPEVLTRAGGWSVQGDIYAFGILMLQLLMGRRLPPAATCALSADVNALGEEEGAELLTTHAEPGGVWTNEAAAAMAHAVVRCIRQEPLHRAGSASAAAALLRGVRRMLDLSSTVVQCWECHGPQKLGVVLSCPAPSVPSAAAVAAGGAGAGAGAAAADEPLDPETAHHQCRSCLAGRIRNASAASMAIAGGRIACAWPGCTHPARSIAELAPYIGMDTAVAYAGKQAGAVAAMQAQRSFQDGLRAKLQLCMWGAGSASFPERVAAGAAAVQEASTLRCPRCAVPCIDVVGCNAVTCGTVGAAAAGSGLGCGATFCAACSREFATAAACDVHVAAVHADGGALHDFDDAKRHAAQKERRAAACIETVAQLAAAPDGLALQVAVVAAIGDVVLADVGLTQASLMERAAAGAAMAATAVAGAQLAPGILEELRSAAAMKCWADVKALCNLVRQLCLHKEGAAALFLAADAPTALLDAMRQCSGDSTAFSAAVNATVTLAQKCGGGARSLVDAGVVPLLVAAMGRHSGSDLCVRTAANVLGEIAAADPVSKQAVVDAGAIHALLAALRKIKDPQPTIARAAIAALGSIAAGDTRNQEQLVREGAVILLVDTMKRHHQSPAVSEAVCDALRHISLAENGKVVLLRDVSEHTLKSVQGKTSPGSKAQESATKLLQWLQENK